MIIIRSLPSPFDVDGTLVLPAADRGEHVNVYDPIEHKLIRMRVHEPMVRLLKEEHHRGNFVIVWSRGGYEWAAEVVKALKLEDYVHLISDKPFVIFDDLPVEDWLKYRVFLPPDTVYKR